MCFELISLIPKCSLQRSQLFSAPRNHGRPLVRLVGTGGGREGNSTPPIRLSDSPRTIWRPSPSRGRHELARSIPFGNRLPSSSGCRSACRSWLSPENEVQPPPRRPLRSDPRHAVARHVEEPGSTWRKYLPERLLATIVTGERVGAHHCPVDVVSYPFEEHSAVAVLKSLEYPANTV